MKIRRKYFYFNLKKYVKQLLFELNREGNAIVVVTHDLEHASRFKQVIEL